MQMFGNYFQKRESKLEKPIDAVLNSMELYGPESDEFAKLMRHLDDLNTMQTQERQRRVSPDTVAIVAGNILGILIVVAYEQKHVVVSKAMGMLLRTKSSNHS
jgi:hypothetical protein